MRTRTLGSLRRVDCVEAEVVLACGVYLTFRLDYAKPPEARHLVEVSRSRKGARPRESIPVDAYTYLETKRAVVKAIAGHREKMRLPPPQPRVVNKRPEFQYRLPI